ncbi:hypothetical protein HOY80DRAFT_1093114 [Tuber brumale]|nr:hypothetical protein HOY80DRAFT_1093114 [Tuber brumale]
MGRKPAETIKNARTPGHITEIGMTSELYYELKVYIKSLIVPGTPAFECERLTSKESKEIYDQLTNNILNDIGPKLFPGGANGLVWPEDRNRFAEEFFNRLIVERWDSIYKAVNQVVRVLSSRIRNKYKKGESRAAGEKGDNNELKMAQDNLHKGNTTAETDDTGGKKDDITPDEYEKFAGLEQEEEEAFMIAMGQENPGANMMDEGMDPEPADQEYQAGLMMVYLRIPYIAISYLQTLTTIYSLCSALSRICPIGISNRIKLPTPTALNRYLVWLTYIKEAYHFSVIKVKVVEEIACLPFLFS